MDSLGVVVFHVVTKSFTDVVGMPMSVTDAALFWPNVMLFPDTPIRME